MIKIALQLVGMDDWLGVSENMEIAKGKYEIKNTIKQGLKQVKRDIGWLRK